LEDSTVSPPSSVYSNTTCGWSKRERYQASPAVRRTPADICQPRLDSSPATREPLALLRTWYRPSASWRISLSTNVSRSLVIETVASQDRRQLGRAHV